MDTICEYRDIRSCAFNYIVGSTQLQSRYKEIEPDRWPQERSKGESSARRSGQNANVEGSAINRNRTDRSTVDSKREQQSLQFMPAVAYQLVVYHNAQKVLTFKVLFARFMDCAEHCCQAVRSAYAHTLDCQFVFMLKCIVFMLQSVQFPKPQAGFVVNFAHLSSFYTINALTCSPHSVRFFSCNANYQHCAPHSLSSFFYALIP